MLTLAPQLPELGPAPASVEDDPPWPGGKACEKHSMTPFASVVQHRSGWPCGDCHPGGQEPHAVGGVGHEPGGAQLHGGHVPESSGQAGQVHEPLHAGPPKSTPPDAVHVVAPLLSV